MGAWGYNSFENDDAHDWLADLVDGKVITPIEDALDAVLDDQDDYLEVDVSNSAIAASEIVAALSGRASKSVPKPVVDWIRSKPKPKASLRNKARRALVRILGDNSELKDLWNESPDFAKWKASVKNLEKRLGS